MQGVMIQPAFSQAERKVHIKHISALTFPEAPGVRHGQVEHAVLPPPWTQHRTPCSWEVFRSPLPHINISLLSKAALHPTQSQSPLQVRHALTPQQEEFTAQDTALTPANISREQHFSSNPGIQASSINHISFCKAKQLTLTNPSLILINPGSELT